MNSLVDKFGMTGFAVLGVSCNQFGHQTQNDNDEILLQLKTIRPGSGFVPAFPVTKKVLVNGEGEHPLFTFLKTCIPVPECTKGCEDIIARNQNAVIWEPVRRSDIGWNFEKFLIGKDGVPVKRYSRYYPTVDIAHDIEKLIQ